MKKLLTIAIATLGVSMGAHAGFLIEPGVGVQGVTGTTSFSYKSGAATTYNYTEASTAVNLLLAYKAMNGLFFGGRADYYMNGTFTPTTATGGGTDTFTRTVAAAVIGYQGARGIRAWAGYDVSNSITNTIASNSTAGANDFTALSGTGYQVGLGWEFHPHFAFNVLYDVPTYTAITPKAGGTGTFTSSTYNTFTDGYMQVNLSFPFGDGK